MRLLVATLTTIAWLCAHPGLAFPTSSISTSICPEVVSKDLFQHHKKMARRLKKVADANPSISWSTFVADPDSYSGRRVEVWQTDFDAGTLRLTVPVYLALMENITFNPNAQSDYRAPHDSAQYAASAYRLDFFAAITVEAADVTIDGGGFSIQQSIGHRLEQRFYAHIELADKPFITNQGPANFGDLDIKAADGCVIHDIHLGRSSHHGIHGNAARNIYLHDVDCKDYEVACIALNGWENVVQSRVHALGTSRDIPVYATYSHARFLLPVVESVIEQAGESAPASETATLVALAAHLAAVMADVFQDVVVDEKLTVDPTLHPEAYALFANPSNQMDGNTYGFLYNKLGVAVNAFLCSPGEIGDEALTGLLLIDCATHETHVSIQEIVALQKTSSGAVQLGPIGEVFRIQDVVNASTGEYNGNALSDVQVALAAFILALPGGSGASLDSAIVAWANTPGADLRPLIADGSFRYLRNADSMFHVARGVIGVRIDGGSNICLTNVLIADTVNAGPPGQNVPLPGETAAMAYYTGATDGGHPNQSPQKGFMGTDARGLSVAATNGVHLLDVAVDGVSSDNGFARGVDVFNGAQHTAVGNLAVSNLHALRSCDNASVTPSVTFNKIGSAIGLSVTSESAQTLSRATVAVDAASFSCAGMPDQTMSESIVYQPFTAERCPAASTSTAAARKGSLRSGAQVSPPSAPKTPRAPRATCAYVYYP